jgi:hypothetical protein
MIALRSKYKVRGDWLHKDPMKNASCISDGNSIGRIIALTRSFRKGARFIIGDRNSVDCWKDPWVRWLTNFLPKPKNDLVPTNPLLVSNLINQHTNTWRQDILLDLFDAKSIDAINKILLPTTHSEYKLIWIIELK